MIHRYTKAFFYIQSLNRFLLSDITSDQFPFDLIVCYFCSTSGITVEAINPEHKCSACKGEDVMSMSYCISCDKKLCAHHQQVITLHLCQIVNCFSVVSCLDIVYGMLIYTA